VAIAGPPLLIAVCRRAARSTAFPTPQDLKWGICHAVGEDEPLLNDYAGIDRSRAFFASQFSIRLAERNDANQHCQLK